MHLKSTFKQRLTNGSPSKSASGHGDQYKSKYLNDKDWDNTYRYTNPYSDNISDDYDRLRSDLPQVFPEEAVRLD